VFWGLSVAAHKFGGMAMVLVFGGTGAGVVDVGRPAVVAGRPVAEALFGVVGLRVAVVWPPEALVQPAITSESVNAATIGVTRRLWPARGTCIEMSLPPALGVNVGDASS
jgi:hypothetical protein